MATQSNNHEKLTEKSQTKSGISQNTFVKESPKAGILVRKDASTNPEFGKRPEERNIQELINMGIVIIDKPSGPTSHQVSDYVQKILKIEKAGHSGTLDPGVTGVLPVALERATRIVQVLLGEGKEYMTLMHLHQDVSEEKIREECNKFIGRITQLPPRKSAIKREERERTIYYLEILEINGQDVLFKVGCEAGTYIRKLCHDLGRNIGGAHMAELRRTRASIFTEDQAVSLQDLADAYYYWSEEGKEEKLRAMIMPVEKGIEHLKKIWVIDTAVDSLCHGADLKFPGVAKINSDVVKGDTIAVLTLKGELICLGDALVDAKQVMQEKGLAVKTNKVFMQPGIYPGIPKSV